MTHICVSNLTTIGSDNGLSPGRRQAIILTNAGMLLIGPFGTNFSEISIEIDAFSFKKIHLKMSSRKWRPFCLGLNVLTVCYIFLFRWRPPTALVPWRPGSPKTSHSANIPSKQVKGNSLPMKAQYVPSTCSLLVSVGLASTNHWFHIPGTEIFIYFAILHWFRANVRSLI